VILPRANLPSLALDATAAALRGLVFTVVGAVLMVPVAVVVMVVMVVAQPALKCFCQGKDDIALAGVRKLAFESYPAWTAIHANAGQCPTAVQLAEYGGSATDPWGQLYDIDCTDLRDLHVSSRGADKRAGTGDDRRSWE
jgi:hypothetical protein